MTAGLEVDTASRCAMCGVVGIHELSSHDLNSGTSVLVCPDCERGLAETRARSEHTTVWISCRSCGQKFPSASTQLSHCDFCRKSGWPPRNPEIRQRMAQVYGAMLLMGDGWVRAVDVRRWLGDKVTVWPWMLDELVEQGMAAVDRSDRRPGFQRYCVPRPATGRPIRWALRDDQD